MSGPSPCPGDAGIPGDLERAVERFGRLDGLAHCIGSIPLKSLHLTTPEEFAEAIHVNLTIAFLACRAARGAMKAQTSGSVVLVSTVTLRQGMNHHDIIAAAKGGWKDGPIGGDWRRPGTASDHGNLRNRPAIRFRYEGMHP